MGEAEDYGEDFEDYYEDDFEPHVEHVRSTVNAAATLPTSITPKAPSQVSDVRDRLKDFYALLRSQAIRNTSAQAPTCQVDASDQSVDFDDGLPSDAAGKAILDHYLPQSKADWHDLLEAPARPHRSMPSTPTIEADIR